MQNFYNIARRHDDVFIDELAKQGVAYVPFFPMGGSSPLQSSPLDRTAASLQATPMQIALAWLLQRSPNILLIPGTSSLKHLHENLEASMLEIPTEALRLPTSTQSASPPAAIVLRKEHLELVLTCIS